MDDIYLDILNLIQIIYLINGNFIFQAKFSL
jgi:hypothetical protein